MTNAIIAQLVSLAVAAAFGAATGYMGLLEKGARCAIID